MGSLDIYGKIIREYASDGVTTLDTGQSCKCSVCAVQLADGKIMASCHFPEDINPVLLCLNKENSFTSVKGVTEDGEEFLLEGRLLYTNSNIHSTQDGSTIDIVFIANNLKFTKLGSEAVKLVRFGITNFEYFGNKLREYPNGGGAWDILSVNLGDKTIEIHKVPDHKVIMESVKAQRGIDVTSEALVNISSINDLDTVIPIIDTLCKLLSLARGTKINWIYYDCYDSLGEKVLSFHKNSVTRQYASLALIDPRNPDETAAFIKQAYIPYVSMQDKYGLEKAIEAYLDAKCEGVYLETRALVAAVLLDFLSGRYTGKKNQFRKNVEATLQWLGITASNDDLDRIVEIRNSLAHEASFIANITKEYLPEYALLISILDQMFLKILNYDGVYLDITDRYKRVSTRKTFTEAQ
jgi:hypothetical protein